MKQVLVTTLHRGVFAGEVPDGQDMDARSVALTNARMAIRWGTTHGVMQLAHTGPTAASRISARADVPALHDVTAIFTITPEAWEKWISA
jgi:hypothetical protein